VHYKNFVIPLAKELKQICTELLFHWKKE
jgi:hypothetical protein